MQEDVKRVLESRGGRDELLRLVSAIEDERVLWDLMSAYNWGDGYAVPLAVVRHPRCDRALALRLFWELDESAQLYCEDDGEAMSDQHSGLAAYEPEMFRDLLTYCEILSRGLRDNAYVRGKNTFDTGFHALDDPRLSDRQRTLRAAHTKRAQQKYDDAFLIPVLPYPGAAVNDGR